MTRGENEMEFYDGTVEDTVTEAEAYNLSSF